MSGGKTYHNKLDRGNSTFMNLLLKRRREEHALRPEIEQTQVNTEDDSLPNEIDRNELLQSLYEMGVNITLSGGVFKILCHLIFQI